MKLEEIEAIRDPMQRLVRIMQTLRAPDGCPWDRKQTLETLTRYMREECAEVTDAVMEKDYPGLCDELGDLLMNIVFSAIVAEEQHLFNFEAVAAASSAKMIRRHPHVFGNAAADTPDQVVTQWDQIKRQEKADRPEPESLLDGIPKSYSALMRAEAVQKRAAKIGFDWPATAPILDKIAEELAEVKSAMAEHDDSKIDEEIGDLLFAVVNLARFRKRGPAEDLLLEATRKFERRFHYIEKRLRETGVVPAEAGVDTLEKYWEEAKHQGF